MEGPLPFMPYRMRWGITPATRLETIDGSPGQYELVLDGRSAVADLILTVRLDGKAGVHRFTNKKFELMKFPMKLSAGPHMIEIDYSGAAGSDPNYQMTVLYREMKLVKARPASKTN
jgi:hypothetical protein